MQIESQKLENGVLVKVSGRMDAANAHEFQEECQNWIARGATHILVELSDLKYVSSMGLSCFLAVAKALQQKSGSIVLCRLQGLPRQVFEMTRLISLFPVFDTTEAAIASVS